jgi:hypothetical protein
MRTRATQLLFALVVLAGVGLVYRACARAQEEPQPKVVEAPPGQPPSDAMVLFEGKDLSNWTRRDGQPARCEVRDAAMACRSGVGDIVSKQTFRSAQIHLEFAIPSMPQQHGQTRGNSGVYLHGRYEIQVLDSYQNPTYANGSCGALYGQYAPLVNVSRPPEQWQTYDIIFHAPKCDAQGKVVEKGRLTLLQNGVLIQDNVEIKGPASGAADRRVCEAGPLLLQDHSGFPGAPVTVMRFRNIWFRPL